MTCARLTVTLAGEATSRRSRLARRLFDWRMRAQGAITDAEFQTTKAKVLGSG